MKKYGFTLVELLVVIAILSILVLIVVPNVLGMFNEAKQNTFEIELREIYNTAQHQWMVDSIQSKSVKKYARTEVVCAKELSLTGRTNLLYYVKIDEKGNVIKFMASDGTYQFVYSGIGLKITDIVNSQEISDLNNNQIIDVTTACLEE